MWLADQWNDYEVIDCSKGEAQTLGKYDLPACPFRYWDNFLKRKKAWQINGDMTTVF